MGPSCLRTLPSKGNGGNLVPTYPNSTPVSLPFSTPPLFRHLLCVPVSVTDPLIFGALLANMLRFNIMFPRLRH